MAKLACGVCGYIHEGDVAPDFCPICKAPAEKFTKQEGEINWATEHVVDVTQGAPKDIMNGPRINFGDEYSKVGMYLAMARVAYREGYPEIGIYCEKTVYEEAEYTAKFTELLGEVITNSTKRNLETCVNAENGVTAGRSDLTKHTKVLNLDAIRDTVYEMTRDETRHGGALKGLLDRYFKQCISQRLDSCDNRFFLQEEKAGG